MLKFIESGTLQWDPAMELSWQTETLSSANKFVYLELMARRLLSLCTHELVN